MSDEQPSDAPSARQPISPGTRRRLQQCFEHGNRNLVKGDHDYANDMFTQCVTGDPGNQIYAQTFLGNLQKKYNNNKKGSKLASLKGAGTKASIKKAAGKKDWPGVIKSGCDMLALNPWDATALCAMADACRHLGHDECELFYLKSSLTANPKDPELNKRSAQALARQGDFDQAIACWHRVEVARPNDEEAKREISNLTVERTIHSAGYEEKTAAAVDPDAAPESGSQRASEQRPTVSPEKTVGKTPSPAPRRRFPTTSNWPSCMLRITSSSRPKSCSPRRWRFLAGATRKFESGSKICKFPECEKISTWPSNEPLRKKPRKISPSPSE